MNREDLSEQEYQNLIEEIYRITIKRGLKASTMDHVAKTLGMSKRTLYEIFGSKNEMICAVFEEIHQRHKARIKEVFDHSKNVMEAMLTIFQDQRDLMERVNASFFRDMDTYYKEMRPAYEKVDSEHDHEMLKLFRRGVEQGVFRSDVNYAVQTKMMKVQMESLKRMEELFPPGITLLEAYDSINIGFLRGIASPKGMKMLDAIIDGLQRKETASDADGTTADAGNDTTQHI